MLRNVKKIWVLVSCAIAVMIIQVLVFNKTLNHSNDDKNLSDIYGNIDFMSNRTDKSKELSELVKEFEAMHPNVNINMELIGDVGEILERKASVGDLPDVTLVPSNIDTKELNKYLLPIDDLGFNENNIYDYISGVGSDGKLYNLSTSFLWKGVIYNKEIFKDLGIDELPDSEAEFFEICSKIKEKGIVPIALNYRQSWIMDMWIDTIPYLYNPKMESRVIEESDDILSQDGEIYKSLNFVRKIYTMGYCEEDIVNYDWPQCKEDIVEGKTAMIIWNSDFINQLVDLGMDKDNLGMFPVPETNTIKVTGDYKMGVSKSTKYPDAAKEFLKFLFEKDRYAKAVNIMSSLKGSENTKEMVDNISKFNIPIVFQENVTTPNGEDNSTHDEYTYLRKNIGLDYSFIQNYITSEDTKKIEEEANEKWKKNKESY